MENIIVLSIYGNTFNSLLLPFPRQNSLTFHAIHFCCCNYAITTNDGIDQRRSVTC